MSLKELNLRIKGVKNTKKITKAMKMVSYSKLKKIQFHLLLRNNHISFLNVLERKRINQIDYRINIIKFLKKFKSDNKLIFLISSDKGLCGSLNIFNLKLVKFFLIEKNYFLYLIGKKGINSLSKEYNEIILNNNIQLTLNSLGEKSILFIVNNLCKYLYFSKIKKSILLGNKYKNTSKNYCVYSYLFLKFKMNYLSTFFNNDKKNLLFDLYYYLNYNLIYSLFLDNQTSEESSRTNAMENSTQNASNRIELLERELKTLRQSIITTELLEIISGAESLASSN